MAEPLHVPILKNDPSGFQAEINDLNAALQNWQRTRAYGHPNEERLAQITIQCARMVEAWQQVHRTATVAGGAEHVGARSMDDMGERLRTLERTIEREWESLRENQDDRATKSPEPAGGLTQSTLDAADLTLRGFARTEARLAALEQDLQGRMAQLSSDLQAVVAELRSARTQPPPAAAPAFPLESVMRIHEELRESDSTAMPPAAALNAGAPRALPASTESAIALTARVDSLERALGEAAAAGPASRRRPLYSTIGVVIAVAAMALFGLWMQRRVDARLNDAAERVAAAERERDATTAAARQQAERTREEAARQVQEARQSAAHAQIVGNVLAAPDRVRFWLAAADSKSRAYAQVLFSRSRGIVFSASRLPQAAAGTNYQLWLITADGPVSVGAISPDDAGRVTFATDAPLTTGSRVTGALVTLESAGGGSTPGAERVLIPFE